MQKNEKRKFFTPLFQRISKRTALLFISGLLFLIIPILFYANQTIQLIFFTPKVPLVPSDKPTSKRLTISSVNIDLPIAETTIQHGLWSISDKGASHLNVSVNPGEIGPIILYSHNTNDRFGPIRWVNKGDTIKVTTVDKIDHIYKVTKTVTVNPKDTQIFFSHQGETLFLFTCDGIADLKRYIVIAKPTKQHAVKTY